LLAWLYLLREAARMHGMTMDGMSMPGMAMDGMAMDGMAMDGMDDMLGARAWTWFDAGLMFLMWAVMMVGMMVPSAAPTTLLYGAVARKAAAQGSPLASTAVFVGGYLTMWVLFSAVATAAQWGLERAALLSSAMAPASPALGAALLIAAGVYQLTPLKSACLRHCRSPAHFLSAHWRDGTAGAFRMGFEHGAFCLGCCWVLMGLLFVGGVMNLLWVAAIALFVLAEKLVPHGAGGGRLAGVAMIVAGAAILATQAM
jgi:predicted metal-binding membrane protein